MNKIIVKQSSTKESTIEELNKIMMERKILQCNGCRFNNYKEEYLVCCYCQDGDLYEKEDK